MLHTTLHQGVFVVSTLFPRSGRKCCEGSAGANPPGGRRRCAQILSVNVASKPVLEVWIAPGKCDKVGRRKITLKIENKSDLYPARPLRAV